MFNFAANLGFIFPQCPFLDRFSAAARAGFQRCEFLFPYYFKPEDLGTKLSASELMQALFNLPPGNWDAGRGWTCGTAWPGSGFCSLNYACPAVCIAQDFNVIAMQSDKHAMEMFSKEDTNYSKVAEKMKFFMCSRGPMQV